MNQNPLVPSFSRTYYIHRIVVVQINQERIFDGWRRAHFDHLPSRMCYSISLHQIDP